MKHLSLLPIALLTRTEETLESTPPEIADIAIFLPIMFLISSTFRLTSFPGFQVCLQPTMSTKKFFINCLPNWVCTTSG